MNTMNNYDYNEGIEFYGIMPKVMEATSIKTIGENQLEVIDYQETAWGGGVSPEPEPEPEPDTHEYVDLGLPSGTLWATENIKNAVGNELYFAWGETQGYMADAVGMDKDFTWDDYEFGPIDWDDGTNYGMTKYNITDGKRVFDAEDDAATANWGSGWRMPTKEQFDELTGNTTTAWTQVDGVNGLLFTSTANTNTLFFPAVGYAAYGDVYDVGDCGSYWSASLFDGDVYGAWELYFFDGDCGVDNRDRCCGYSVRPVRSNN